MAVKLALETKLSCTIASFDTKISNAQLGLDAADAGAISKAAGAAKSKFESANNELAAGFAMNAAGQKEAADARVNASTSRAKNWTDREAAIREHHIAAMAMYATKARGLNFKERYEQIYNVLEVEAREAYVKLKAIKHGLDWVHKISLQEVTTETLGDFIDNMAAAARNAISRIEGSTDRDIEFDVTISFRGGNQFSRDPLVEDPSTDNDWWKDHFLYGEKKDGSPHKNGIFKLKLDPKFFPFKNRLRIREVGLSYSLGEWPKEFAAVSGLVKIETKYDDIVPMAFLNNVDFYNHDRTVSMQAGTMMNADPFHGDGKWTVQIGEHYLSNYPGAKAIRPGGGQPDPAPHILDFKLHIRLIGRI